MCKEQDKQKIDIIIPVYNALADLQLCIPSVLKYTDLKKHRLIVINDVSTDPNVDRYLSTLEELGVCVLVNETNLGFSATVNKGIGLSEDRDIILLNSDTIVTRNWIEKLVECAYSEAAIATVTPLSNNASICSVPVSGEENFIPNGVSVDEYAEEIERISLMQYPKIPVAIGFCMFIKRSVISEVGLFDGETFGKGYGEENDYCNRISELGYCHVVCDNVFIYHKGTSSFEEEIKSELIGDHEGILEERYPQLMRQLELYWANRQNSVVLKNIELYSKLELYKKKKNILYLIQADFQDGCSNNIGGTQLHVKDLVNGLKHNYNIFVGARDGEIFRLTAYIGNEVIQLKFYMGGIPAFYVYRDKEISQLYRDILLAFDIDVVHIHHTMWMTLELYYVAKSLSIPIYTSLHDYYYICPTLRLLNTEKRSCVGEFDNIQCAKCMKKSFGVYDKVAYMDKWREEHAKVLSFCQKIIIPSRSAKEILCQYYPNIQEKEIIIHHGIDLELFSKRNKEIYNHKQLRIGFVGGISDTKGSDVIYDLVKSSSDQFGWYIFGGIDDADLLKLNQPNYKKIGWYDRADLKNLLEENEIDVVCLLSKVAETYCYTLSETVACGVPVIVTDIGALGERMRVMQCGWIVPPDASGKDILKVLIGIQNHQEEYNKVWKTVQEYAIRGIDEMVTDYFNLYQRVEKTGQSMKEYNAQRILDAYVRGLDGANPNVGTFELQSQVERLEREIQMIYDAEIFKMMKKIASFLDFAKKTVKRLFGK